jgi:hypothetical protein
LFSDAERSIQRNKEREALADMRFALADSEQELKRGRFDLKQLLRNAREREDAIEGILSGQTDFDKLVNDTRQREEDIDTTLALGDLLQRTRDKASAIKDFSKGGLPVDEDELFDLGRQLGVDQEILDSGDFDLIRSAIKRASVEADADVPARPDVPARGSYDVPLSGVRVLDDDEMTAQEEGDFDAIPDDIRDAILMAIYTIPTLDYFQQQTQSNQERMIRTVGQELARIIGNERVFAIPSLGQLMTVDELIQADYNIQQEAFMLMNIGRKDRPRKRGGARPPSPSSRRDLTGSEARQRRSSEDTVGGVPPAGTASQMASTLGSGMRGRGLGRSKPKTPVEKSDGYEKPVQYTQFGRYLIHHPKLKQGILQMKTPKGGAIKALPSEYLSPRLKDTMLTLVGNGSPSLEQFDKLTPDEKDKLHHITKHSQYEKVSIPRGHMDKEDQMLHKFTILKGELLAGNNSKQLLKEFKSMLIKFVEEGRIPKRQAHEILVELAKEGM